MMKSNTKPNRPTLSMLLGIYTVWISAIVAIITMPSLSFLGVLAAALLLFVWLPYWARVNWTFVVNDLSATYATITVSLILLVLLGLMIHYSGESIHFRLVESGWSPWLLNCIEWFSYVVVIVGIGPTWRWFRRAFTRTPSKVAEPPPPKANS